MGVTTSRHNQIKVFEGMIKCNRLKTDEAALIRCDNLERGNSLGNMGIPYNPGRKILYTFKYSNTDESIQLMAKLQYLKLTENCE